MKKVLEILRLITYYIIIFIFSGLGIGFLPIGAMATISSVYASGGILAPTIVLSILSTVLFIGWKALIPLLIFLILFLVPVLFIRPLESIEGRNERKKVGNYVLFASIFSFVFFGFLEGIYAVFLCLAMYKIFVNILAVLKNEDEKLVFSMEENIGLSIVLCIAVLLVSTYFNLSIIYPVIVIGGILGYTAIKKGVVESILSYVFTIFIYVFVILTKLNISIVYDFSLYNIMLFILPTIMMAIIAILRNFSRIVIYLTIAILNIGLFFICYSYFNNILYYFPYLLMSAIVIIVADDYERRKLARIKSSRLITDEGETRLQTEEKYVIKQEKDKKKIVELFNDKDNFLNRIYTKEEVFKDLLLYDEIQESDNILEEIYFLIKDDGYIDRKKFNKILIKNNVVIDIHSYEMEEEIRILEILTLRELKEIVREREEKEIKREKEEALQNDKKDDERLEETNAITYNKIKEGSNVKGTSVRDLKKKSEEEDLQ